MNGMQVIFDPLLGWPVVAALGALALAVTALSLWRRLAGWALRGLAFALVLAALANPSLQTEERDPLPDLALIVRDVTGSNLLAGREVQTEQAEARLRAELARLGVEPRLVTVTDAPDNGGSTLNAALEAALADLPRDRLAGVFVVSDGLAHDAPISQVPAPLHLVQTGEPGDWDRRLILRNAPAYGILGETLHLTLRIEDEGAVPDTCLLYTSPSPRD